MARLPQPAGGSLRRVRQPFSADGSHFVFGTERQFEPRRRARRLSIYDRNLAAGGTQARLHPPEGLDDDRAAKWVSSTSPETARDRGRQADLDDVKGNEFYHLYMHIGTSPNSVDPDSGDTGCSSTA